MQTTEFERFFKENYSKIYYLVLSLLHDEEIARDIVSDSFEYLFTHHSHCRKMKLVITCLSVPGIVALIIFENRLFGSVILIM